MKNNPWLWMLVTFGLFLIMMSPTQPSYQTSLFSGVIVTLTGILGLVLKNRKKR